MVIVFLMGKLVYGFSPLGERVGLQDYSSLGERMGEMVMVFPLGKLVYEFSLLWERVKRNGNGLPAGEAGVGILPTGGEGGLHDYSPRWVKWLWSSHWRSWFMNSPHWGRG